MNMLVNIHIVKSNAETHEVNYIDQLFWAPLLWMIHPILVQVYPKGTLKEILTMKLNQNEVLKVAGHLWTILNNMLLTEV